MCAGDMTLEWANWEGKEPRIDGWGMKHRGCRSWVSLDFIRRFYTGQEGEEMVEEATNVEGGFEDMG